MDRQTSLSVSESAINGELSRIPPGVLVSVRRVLGMQEKELQALTFEEKTRLVNLARQRLANRVTMNGGMMWPGPGPMPGSPMNSFPYHLPPLSNPGMGIPMGPQTSINATSPAMGNPRALNMIGQPQHLQGIDEITKGLAFASISGGGAGTPASDEPPFNPPFVGPQSVNGNGQVNTARPTPSATSLSITAPPPSGAVNGTPTMNPATQPTPLPEIPANFLTSEFMQSVANTLNEFDQSLFRPDDGINFEQDFREWFEPEGSVTSPLPSDAVHGAPTVDPATRPTPLPEVPTNEFMQTMADTFYQGLFSPEDDIDFERDFQEWFC